MRQNDGKEQQPFAREVGGAVLWGCGATAFALLLIFALAAASVGAGVAGLTTGSAPLLGLGIGLFALALALGLVYFASATFDDSLLSAAWATTPVDGTDRRVPGVPIAIAGGLALVAAAGVASIASSVATNALGAAGTTAALLPGLVALVGGILLSVSNARRDIGEAREAADLARSRRQD